METALDGSAGHFAGSRRVRADRSVDGVDSWRGLHHPGKLHDVADVVFYEGVRQNVASTHGLRLKRRSAPRSFRPYMSVRGSRDRHAVASGPKAG